MRKRLLSIILSVAVALTMMPAAEGLSFAGEANTTVPVELVKAQTSGTRAVKLSWNKVSGATKYVVYGQKCGKSYKKLKTTSSTSYVVKKIKGKKLKAHKNYKFYVTAYSGNKKLVSSKTIHFITAKTNGKYANASGITAKYSSKTLAPGQKFQLGATVKIYKNKKHLPKSHGAKLRYTSNNPGVASVNANGVVTAKSEGTAKIYIQDTGGLYVTTAITVKKPAPVEDFSVKDEFKEITSVMTRIDFNADGYRYYPVFNSVPEGVNFYKSDGTVIYSMDANIAYAMVPEGTTIKTLRFENNISWNDVFCVESEGHYPCEATGVNKDFADNHLVGDDEANEQIFKFERDISWTTPVYNGVSLTDIWRAYNPNKNVTGFGGEHGAVWSNTTNSFKNAFCWNSNMSEWMIYNRNNIFGTGIYISREFVAEAAE